MVKISVLAIGLVIHKPDPQRSSIRPIQITFAGYDTQNCDIGLFSFVLTKFRQIVDCLYFIIICHDFRKPKVNYQGIQSRSRNRNMQNILLGQNILRCYQRQKRSPSVANAASRIEIKPKNPWHRKS